MLPSYGNYLEDRWVFEKYWLWANSAVYYSTGSIPLSQSAQFSNVLATKLCCAEKIGANTMKM